MSFITLIGNLLVYITVFIFAFKFNKRASERVSWWKIVIVLFIGLISFSIHLEFFGTLHQFALLPLGVFLLYIFTRKNKLRWYKYRLFAWLGFCANFGFFIVSIATIPIFNSVYPPNEIDTYIKSIEHARILNTHISKTEPVKLVKNAHELLQQSEQDRVKWDDWFYEHTDSMHQYSYETFPYMLTDVEYPFGMDKPVNFYIEQDGMGLLIMTDDLQYYFRSKQPILEVGGEADA